MNWRYEQETKTIRSVELDRQEWDNRTNERPCFSCGMLPSEGHSKRCQEEAEAEAAR